MEVQYGDRLRAANLLLRQRKQALNEHNTRLNAILATVQGLDLTCYQTNHTECLNELEKHVLL
jgi:hypothetical protein